ncbi:MAG TPA: hypothetical protein ENG61_01145 [Candidatus Korarchaeota archaeon]|nr:hypothetical protein [Candidatus Korarchaeota archaeon]
MWKRLIVFFFLAYAAYTLPTFLHELVHVLVIRSINLNIRQVCFFGSWNQSDGWVLYEVPMENDPRVRIVESSEPLARLVGLATSAILWTFAIVYLIKGEEWS